MGFVRRVVRRVTRSVRRVVSAGKDIFKTVKSAIKDPIGTIKQVAGKFLDKLPLPDVFKQFVGQFLQNPMALLAAGPLAGFAAMVGMTGSLPQLAQTAQMVSQTHAFMSNPQSRQNAMEAYAAQQARLFFGI